MMRRPQRFHLKDIHQTWKFVVVHPDVFRGKLAIGTPAHGTYPWPDFTVRPFLAGNTVAAVFPGGGKDDKSFTSYS